MLSHRTSVCPVLPTHSWTERVCTTQGSDADTCVRAPSASREVVTDFVGPFSRACALPCFSLGHPTCSEGSRRRRGQGRAGQGRGGLVLPRAPGVTCALHLRDFTSSSLISVRLFVLVWPMALRLRFTFLVILQIPPLLLTSGCWGHSFLSLALVCQPSCPVGVTWPPLPFPTGKGAPP